MKISSPSLLGRNVYFWSLLSFAVKINMYKKNLLGMYVTSFD